MSERIFTLIPSLDPEAGEEDQSGIGAPRVFGRHYSALYDHFYQDKDYSGECDLLERTFAAHARTKVHDVLDLGCGTGGHALILAQRGYRVTGVDRSPAMVKQAREKAGRIRAGHKPVFHLGDLREFRSDKRFDAVLMMFAVIGYQVEDEDMKSALVTARHHLRPGSLLIFDCWHGPAVDSQTPEPRTKIVETANGRIVRSSSTKQDRARNCCHVSFRVCEEGGQSPGLTEETHTMRYFYRPELESSLEDAGLCLLRLDALPELDRPADETSWNALGVARVGGA